MRSYWIRIWIVKFQKLIKLKKKKTKKNWLNIQNGPLTLLGHRESSLGTINKKMHVLGHKMT